VIWFTVIYEITVGKFVLPAQVAEKCFAKAKDLGGLLLMASSKADARAMGAIASLAGAGCGIITMHKLHALNA
jgi:hypothetical protein